MILDFIINLVDVVLDVLLLPTELLTLGFNAINFEPLSDALAVACYLLPIKELMPLIAFVFVLGSARVTIALINFVKGYIPFL